MLEVVFNSLRIPKKPHDTCTVRKWSKSECSSVDEWVKGMGYVYIWVFYGVIRKIKVVIFVGKLMQLEIMLSKISQIKNLHFSVCFFIYVCICRLQKQKRDCEQGERYLRGSEK